MIPYALTWGGCQRMYYLAQKLLSKGFDVDVFALRTAKYNTYGKDLLPNVIFSEEILRDSNETELESKYKSKKSGKTNRVLRKIAFNFDTMIFNEITPGNGLVAFKKFKAAEKKLKEQIISKNYDVVVVSGPPFVVFNTIKTVKNTKPNIKIIMDYRDPWNSWHSGNKLCEHREKKIQQIADVVVCTNQALCTDMSDKYNIAAIKYHVVENGFMNEQTNKAKCNEVFLNHDKINLVYTGSISFTTTTDAYRDTKELLEALDSLIRKGINNIRLVFVGEANSDKSYLEKIKEKFHDNILIIGKVNNTSAIEYVKESDACLLLHTADDMSGKFLISGKAYDYIQDKKYIFSISRSDSQHASILKQYQIGLNVTNDRSSIEKGLMQLIDIWKDTGFTHIYDNVNIMRFSRDFHLENYIKIIKNI